MHTSDQALVTTTNRPRLPEVWARSGEAPLWVSICLYAAARSEGGMLRLEPGELRQAFVPDAPDQVGLSAISGAIRRAKAAGWLQPTSTARCLILGRPRQ